MSRPARAAGMEEKLCTTLNPRTVSPRKIVDGKKAIMSIEVWEDKLVKLSLEYGETLSNKVKVAVLYAMMPKDFQEKVRDRCAVSWDAAKESDAATILAKIK